MTMTTATTQVSVGFADDPLASHSAQFPLGRAYTVPGQDTPSERGVRPWNLRLMEAVPAPAELRERGTYDPFRQVSVTRDGFPRITAATANSASSSDGDEGPSEDWTYDFAPDNPLEV
jgi:putative ATP-grasp target RiPP